MAFAGLITVINPMPANAAGVLSKEWIGRQVESLAKASVQAKNEGSAKLDHEMVISAFLGNAVVTTATPETKLAANWSDVDSWNSPKVEEATPAPKPRVKGVRVQPGTTFDVTVTAYSSTVDQTDSSPFITANGSHVHPGTIAANFLPFGTKVKFPDYFGDRIFVVEDRTNAKYSSRIDIWMETREAALQFGKRHLVAVVVE